MHYLCRGRRDHDRMQLPMHSVPITTDVLSSNLDQGEGPGFSNISAISWRPRLVVEEAGVPERTTDPGQATGKLNHLRLHPFL
jgi:hypothetical protein